jgi:phage shock protein PspC (stress-responsive transcriptional regulator)
MIMRPVITISLNGNSYQLEQGGYEALQAYLATAEARLTDNPDKAEVLADLEQAIAEKCGRFLSPHKSVVTAEEVEQVIREMGPVDGSAGGASPEAGQPGAGHAPGTEQPDAARGQPGAHRRLYQIRDGAMLSGVCTGLAAYFNIDVTIVRVIFVALAILTWGAWILAYIVMMFVIPYAHTSEQRAAAHGWQFNAQELIDRAKQHYAQFKDGAHWRRQWREQRRYWRFQQRQWRAQSRHWRLWQRTLHEPPPWWGGHPDDASYAAHILGGLLVPIAAVLGALLFVALVLAIGSLIETHAILGWTLPPHIPLWAAIVILIVLYQCVASPLHYAHRIGRYGPFGYGWLALWGSLLWTGCVVVLVWLAWRHWPEVQSFLQHLPESLHNIGSWWQSPGTPV